jgi:hypothetical protein
MLRISLSEIMEKYHFLYVLLLMSSLFVVSLMLETFEAYPSHRFSTLVIVFCGLILTFKRTVLSFETMSFVIIFFPALTPFFTWDLIGVPFFSLHARQLQANTELVNKFVYFFAIAAIAYVSTLTAILENNKKLAPKETWHLPSYIIALLGILGLICSYILESGPTLLTATYDELLTKRLPSNPLIVFLATSFGGVWAILFLFGRHKKVIFWSVTWLIIIWLTLHSRRIEVLGMGLVMIMWGHGSGMSKVKLYVCISIFISSQFVTGVIRNKPILDNFTKSAELSTSAPIVPLKNSLKGSKAPRHAALPGGASNVFLSGLQIINAKDTLDLRPEQQFTMIQWVRSIIPNQVWKLVGLPISGSEHTLIFEELDLKYAGGMPLLSAFYLNGGIGMVLIFGLFHGYLARSVDYIFRRDLWANIAKGGNVQLLIASVFLIYQFRYQWYNPATLFRAIVFSLFIYVLITSYIKYSNLLIQKFLTSQFEQRELEK